MLIRSAIFFRTCYKPLKKTYDIFCRLTSCFRSSPDFVIVGAQKAGTTSLLDLILQHPDIKRPRAKEVHFFDENFEKGVTWYHSFFPLNFLGKLTGEASPYYLFHPGVPKRLYDYKKNIKIIAILRDPVGRAVSHYHHAVRKGFEDLKISEALGCEDERLAGDLEKIKKGDFSLSWRYKEQSYTRRGLYAEQLERYFDLFPRNQICLLKSEDLFSDPQQEIEKIFEFLGVDSRFVLEDIAAKNVGSYLCEDENTNDYLEKRFAESNQKLANEYGINFG